MFIAEFNVLTIYEKMTGTSEVLPVLGGLFWCLFGIFLRNLYEANQRKLPITKRFQNIPKTELVIKVMVVIAAMRFFRFIFDTDTIALAGFFIGLSLDYLPRIILSIPKVLLERFDFGSYMRSKESQDNPDYIPPQESHTHCEHSDNFTKKETFPQEEKIDDDDGTKINI